MKAGTEDVRYSNINRAHRNREKSDVPISQALQASGELLIYYQLGWQKMVLKSQAINTIEWVGVEL